MSSETNELAESIAQLEERTRAGDIEWSQAAPVVYSALRDMSSGSKRRMTILRAKRSRLDVYMNPFGPPTQGAASEARVSESVEDSPEADFLFQVEVIDKAFKPKTELMIDTRQRPELNEAFQRLFDAAKSSVDAHSARILKEFAA